MVTNDTSVRMIKVNAKMFEAVGYCEASRHLYVKYRNGQVRCFENVPHFRIQGLLSSPRKDGYFKTYLQNSFLSKEAKIPGQP